MKEKMILVAKKEYDSMKETLEILSNKEMMAQIRTSEKNRKKGKVYKFEY